MNGEGKRVMMEAAQGLLEVVETKERRRVVSGGGSVWRSGKENG